jgi:hypothetical protein
MPLLNTARLEAFARLIALGYPPVLAAKAAGYRNLRARRASARLAQPPALAAPKEPRAPQPPTAKETKAADKARAARPPLPPMLTEEEWLAEFAPLIQREKARARDLEASRFATR